MFWLYNNLHFYEFFQIFDVNKVINIDDNKIYNLSKIINFDIDDLSFLEIVYDIHIFDELISYKNINNDETITFSFKHESFNKNNNLIFNWKYKKVNNHKMPLTLSDLYDQNYLLKFQIYKLSNDIIFIKETNIKNLEFKNYWLTTNFNSFEKLK
jgi:hypothetical protein